MAAIGIAANPASGKDVRRLVARASVFDNQEKQAIISRCIAGMRAVGATDLCYMPDSHAITARAIDDHPINAEAIAMAATSSDRDTTQAAAAMRMRNCGAVITLGGDGTNRAFARGWLDAPLIPISTGTNNVFPVLVEGTIAGAAAGLVGTAQVELVEVASRSKRIKVTFDDGATDLALIDAVATRDRFVGSRALLDSTQLLVAVLTRAEPAAVGVTSIGGALGRIGDEADQGLVIEFSGPQPPQCCAVRVPIAPGYYQDVGIDAHRPLAVGASTTVRGPCTLAFDGEREHVLLAGQTAELELVRDGPWVVDVDRTLQQAAAMGAFRVDELGSEKGEN